MPVLGLEHGGPAIGYKVQERQLPAGTKAPCNLQRGWHAAAQARAGTPPHKARKPDRVRLSQRGELDIVVWSTTHSTLGHGCQAGGQHSDEVDQMRAVTVTGRGQGQLLHEDAKGSGVGLEKQVRNQEEAHQLVHEDAKGPDVGLEPRALVAEHLRRGPQRRELALRCLPLGVLQAQGRHQRCWGS